MADPCRYDLLVNGCYERLKLPDSNKPKNSRFRINAPLIIAE